MVFQSFEDDRRSSIDIVSTYMRVDQVLAYATAQLRIIESLEPTNRKEAFEQFLKDPRKEPKFLYAPRSLQETDDVRKQLESLLIPGDHQALAGLFEERRNELLTEVALVEARGDRVRMQELSQLLYGAPSATLVATASQILFEEPDTTSLTVPSSEVVKTLSEELKRLGLTNWSVEYWDHHTTMVRQEERKVLVSRDRMFRPGDAERLAAHEVGVHAVRAENGYRQPFTLFALGLPGYLGTEEGLASYAEQVTNRSDADTLRIYAARVIAVDSLLKGDSFVETAKRLAATGVPDNGWLPTYRAFRGGGFTKDYLYLQGLSDVRAFVEHNGDVHDLMVGKIAIHHLPAVQTLRGDGVLQPPECTLFPGDPSSTAD